MIFGFWVIGYEFYPTVKIGKKRKRDMEKLDYQEELLVLYTAAKESGEISMALHILQLLKEKDESFVASEKLKESA